jgi:hypothetical protein
MDIEPESYEMEIQGVRPEAEALTLRRTNL